ncbi:uncharacterized protein LOC113312051 [Papaver somniferum]|uniref:uncharacterized protein LOC113312051 n=1 Tax=Papaver somniferum TaxID=3469 RepID=UPI000E6FEBA4|nr:uncharacterized protein LOC113312051 [Papaver somniferum]
MDEGDEKSISDLANKFMQAALDLGDVEEVIYHQSDDVEETPDDEEEISLIGKIIIEGKMGIKTIEKNIGFTWNFIPEGGIKVFELEDNIIEFRFKDKDTMKKVFGCRPWSINGFLINLRLYNSEVIYQELDWSKQCFWIQIKKILLEHMNVKALSKIGKNMGEVLAIVPEDGVPVEGEPVKVCVQVDINYPLRKGVMSKTNAGSTRWIKLFYEKQPHKICPSCYILNHTKEACKAVVDYLAKAHDKPHYFGELKIGARKKIEIARGGD